MSITRNYCFMIEMLKKNRFVRFLFSGGISTFINYTLTIALIFFKLNHVVAVSLAWLCATSVNFFLQKNVTFQTKLSSTPHVRFTFFIIWGFANLIITASALDQLIRRDIPYWIADLFILSVLAITNFFVYKHIIYKDSLAK